MKLRVAIAAPANGAEVMSQTAPAQGDASVEDILESIKKVIARDNRAATAGPRRAPANPPVSVVEPAAEPAPASGGVDDVLDLTEAEPYLDVPEETAATMDAESPLVAPEARAAMRESLAALAVVAEPGAAPRVVRSGETSVEDLVREALRPALAQWLDAHLPAMVERLVSAEIARIAGKKG